MLENIINTWFIIGKFVYDYLDRALTLQFTGKSINQTYLQNMEKYEVNIFWSGKNSLIIVMVSIIKIELKFLAGIFWYTFGTTVIVSERNE